MCASYATIPLVFCAGGGRFGTETAQAARSQGTVLVVDIDPQCPARAIADTVVTDLASLQLNGRGEVHLLVGRAEETLLDLIPMRIPSLVVPAIPGHFAAMVAESYLRRRGMAMLSNPSLLKQVVRSLPKEIVVTIDEQNGVLITSHMPLGLRCQTPCVQEPTCPVTGKLKESMSRIISEALIGQSHRVMVSHLLGEVGAISGSDFSVLLGDLRSLKVGDRMALATSCQCHAIVNFFAIAPLSI